MKKFLSLLLALLLLAALAGCDTGQSGASEPGAEEPAGNGTGDADSVVYPPADGSLLGDFSTMDLAQNSVTQDLFAQADLTMINVWATYCGPCLNEMPDLGALHAEYKNHGFQVAGIVIDVLNRDGSYNEDQLDLARDIVADTGAHYIHILPAPGTLDMLLRSVYAVPTTYFVDSEGKQVGEIYIGSKSKADWQAVIDDLLAEVQA